MVKQIDDIKVINVDKVPYDVSACSEQVQALVEYYNEWRRQEFELKRQVVMVEAAQRELSREIISTIRQELEKAEAANDEANAVEVAPAGVEAVPAPVEVAPDAPISE